MWLMPVPDAAYPFTKVIQINRTTSASESSPSRHACFPLMRRSDFLVGPVGSHLAEDALALHFLLQHPKGLMDVVVSHVNAQFIS